MSTRPRERRRAGGQLHTKQEQDEGEKGPSDLKRQCREHPQGTARATRTRRAEHPSRASTTYQGRAKKGEGGARQQTVAIPVSSSTSLDPPDHRPWERPARSHIALGSKADHLAQQLRIRDLLHERAGVHHLIGHRFLESGLCQQPDPTGEVPVTTAKPSARLHGRARVRTALLYRATPSPGTRPSSWVWKLQKLRLVAH